MRPSTPSVEPGLLIADPAGSRKLGRVITSTQNSRIKRIARLRRRGERDATRLFLVEGTRELKRAIQAGVELDQLVYCSSLLPPGGEAILAEAGAVGAELVEVNERVFRVISYRDGPDGLLGVARAFDLGLDRLAVDDDALVLVAAHIEKPGNVGAMLRSAAAADATAVVVADLVTDIFNPNVVRSSLGALFIVPIGLGSDGDVITWLRDRRLRVLAATPHGSTPYWDAPLAGGSAIVIGSERAGLSDVWLEAADEQIVIPMAGGPAVDSLNAATTASIFLFEAIRQRTTVSRP